MAFVLDGSATMPWLLGDDPSGYSNRVLQSFSSERAFVPVIWQLEVAQALMSLEHHARLATQESERFATLLGSLPISTEPQFQQRVFGSVLDLSREFNLSVFDATYLELAIRNSLPLATLQTQLRDAAMNSGVAVYLETQPLQVGE